MRRIFLSIMVCLLGVAVFAAAYYLDNDETHWNKRNNVTETTAAVTETETTTEEPTVTKTESVPTEQTTAPTETLPEETAAQETSAEETAPEETEPETSSPEETAVPETQSEQTQPEETQADQTEPEETVPATTHSPEILADGSTRYVLTFVGDCTLGTTESIYYAPLGFIKTVGTDYDYPFNNVRTYFENDDLTFVNLEGPLTEEGSPCGAIYSFRGPTEYVQILSGSSVEMVSLANNHALDYGPAGYASTKKTLEGASISYVEDDGITIYTLDDGFTVGVYASMFATANEDKLTERITELRQKGVDLIVYAPHWGVERSYNTSWTQDSMGRAAIDAGADIVWGCHPHVLQEIEEYNGGVIYYSLGNFSFGGNSAPTDMDTAVIQQEVIRKPNGTVILGERTIIPCCLSSSPSTNNYQPTPYEPGTKEYDRVLRKLEGTYVPGK